MILKRFGSTDTELLAVVLNIIQLSPSEFMPLPLSMDLSRVGLIDSQIGLMIDSKDCLFSGLGLTVRSPLVQA